MIFGWLNSVMEKFNEQGIKVILVTPSADKPQWLMAKYPNIMMVEETRQRLKPNQRGNHCNTFPLFRDKVTKINRLLAER